MPARCAGALAAWALLLVPCAASVSKYDAAIAERCPDVDGSEPSRDALVEAAGGGENWFLKEVLEKASDRDDILTKTNEYMEGDGGSDVGAKGIGLALFFILLLIYPCVCYTPCCACCRVCTATEKKETSIIYKAIGTVLVLGIGVGLVIIWIFSAAAYEDIADGKQRLGCTAAQLTKALVHGQESPSFIGMTPMTSRFADLSSVLDDDSDFVADFNTLIENTVEIDQAFAFADETLALLQEAMDNSDNANPKGHRCLICTDLAEKLTEVKDTMADSLADALVTARSEARSALDEDKREDLRALLTDAIKPINEINDLLFDALDPLVDGDNWDQVEESTKSGRMTTYVLPGLGLLATLFGLLGLLAFILSEERSMTHQDTGEQWQEARGLPYRCAICSWCCGFFVALLCFLIGGVMQLSGVPLGLACLTFEGFSGSVIDSTQKAWEFDLEDNSLTMMKNIVDQCINPADYTVQANFADILTITSDNGTAQTMRTLVDTDLKNAIDTPFDDLSAKMESVTTVLANESGVITLRNLISTHGGNVASLILTDEASMKDLILADGQDDPGTWAGYAVSLSCADYTYEDSALPGVSAYLGTLTQLDTSLPPCSGGKASCSAEPNCGAATVMMDIKKELMETDKFRCDVFEDASGIECDPWASNPDGVATDYTSCVDPATGQYRRKAVSCSLADFEDYLEKFDVRIDVAFKTLDSVTDSMKTQINTGLRDLLNREIVDEVTEILDGLTCNLLGGYYKSIIWGACYEGVGGVAYLGSLYVITGALMVVLIAVMYALWRRALDNYKLDKAWYAGAGGGDNTN